MSGAFLMTHGGGAALLRKKMARLINEMPLQLSGIYSLDRHRN